MLTVFGIFVVFAFDVNCIFKSVFGIPCPGCGLTRGFRALFSGDFIKAESYNILTIPIFLFLLFVLVLMIIDIANKSNNTEKILKKISNHYILLIIIVCLNWIINIVRGV